MKNKKLFVTAASLVLLLSIVIRVVYINNKYPSPKKSVYAFGQEMPFMGAKIKAVDYEIYSREQMKDKLDEYDYETIFNEKFSTGNLEMKTILITVDIVNDSEETVNPMYLSILSGTICNGINGPLTYALNENGCRMESHSEGQVILAYTITKNNVPAPKWDNFENEEFALTYEDRLVYDVLMLGKK